jgi:hypothetical protein
MTTLAQKVLEQWNGRGKPNALWPVARKVDPVTEIVHWYGAKFYMHSDGTVLQIKTNGRGRRPSVKFRADLLPQRPELAALHASRS